MTDRRFGPRELELVGRLQLDMEQLVGEHWGLASFDWSVEIIADPREPEGVAPEALAKLCRFDRAERLIGDSDKVTRFYRVYLQPHNILTRVEREGWELGALLSYVIAHELIHVVRFERFEVHIGADGRARDLEEDEVHQLTHQVLGALKDEGVRRVADELVTAGVDVVE